LESSRKAVHYFVRGLRSDRFQSERVEGRVAATLEKKAIRQSLENVFEPIDLDELGRCDFCADSFRTTA
jgi:hypothetical protein